MKETKFKVGGMHCRSCEMLVEDSLTELKGVVKAKADHEKGTVTVQHEDDTPIGAIKKAIEKEGYEVVE